MSKFIIENILIEKSDKDIKTGEKYIFSDGFNLICGNNETGKSSLMNFIKKSFFKTKGIDTGKIYFKLEDKIYRADIKDSKKTDERCKIYDETNSLCSYNLIDKNIKQKYFEEGFTINLDDLMKIQNKETEEFINIIKDPSGDKLNSFLEKINNNISLYLSVDGKLKKNAKEILDKISNLNIKIKELSKKEDEYYINLAEITSLNDSIDKIIYEEENLKLFKEAEKISSDLKELLNEKENALLNFNETLYLDKERYIDLIQSSGKYSSNKDLETKCYQKLETINKKISDEKTRLDFECNLSLDDEIINSFKTEPDKIRRIKELIEQANEITTSIKHNEEKTEDLENTLLKLNCEIETIQKHKNGKYDILQLEEIIKTLDEGLKQYHFITSEIDNVNKETIINASAINNNKKLQILLLILFLGTVICAIINFLQKIHTAGIFSILMSILALAGFSSLKLGSYIDNKDCEKQRKEEQRLNILEDLKSKVKPYYEEIDNIESSYLPLKLDSIKQELQTNLKDFKIQNETILKNISERNYTQEKLSNIKTKISDLYSNLEKTKEEINYLSDKNITNNNVFGKKYLEAVEIIKSLKDNFENKKHIQSELEEIKENNRKIEIEIKNFIIENKIGITISENIEEIIYEIKKYYDRNNIVKQHIDTLTSQINSLNKRLNELGEIKKPDLNEEELKQEKEEKLKQKKEAEFKKRELEKVEGIPNLKTDRNILLEEYRTLIKNLFINKMTLELASKAKTEFDKTQPDLINAQKYLTILTDNKYTKINLDLQELENEEGTKIKKWEHLSRGTKEQLYLALRLGYASNYSKDKTTLEPNGRADLPLIVDDAFVNFDLIRTKNALKCLLEFSKTNQVLLFTCHSTIMEKMLKELTNDDLNIIQL